MNIHNDLDGMRLALQWAEKGLYTTSPNPHIGCVIVRDGVVIGAGVTQPAGQDHAEIQALKDAAQRGHDVRGATAYVTLEPCAHYGRTPPCCDALVRAGLGRVVCAMEDPNPLVAGQGLARLAAAGIEVSSGLLADEAYELNIGFFSRMRRQLPWVRLKTAASLDGMTALHNGSSQWITGAEARADGHAWRARACAILTGIGTVKADDPQLNVRAVQTLRQPRRIVIDSRLEIDPGAKVLAGGGTLVVAAVSDHEREAVLRDRGAEIITLANAHGKVDLPELMRELGRRQINELHVEAGTKLNGSLVREGCVDELLVYLAPTLLGDAQGMFALPALTDLAQKRALRFHEVCNVGGDLRILARFMDRP
ncbi:bifunctional diaminohydroxyphosphoribosylaminopyrimidine deaminase/5-amino-6-(5-phosphoribosylamino)uracil reductase RibD [Pseudoduganella plicata]|uniref:Riboflavin biosynthesis protein RibD n=1 Tax=Pseudoduganella plicata TaxID=321984 RepID=A0A4P7BKD6_9BURK|nr:bifunctional diaminohydroxyphosphoribosylaminopyrimidine deaminase/5-amino-6-(5-phosphoribosylamino)uracil reductase RibD [Pseudoduganella plicata]QBQ38920.1 bifunctional diaminohydroxyphosphoribosylaminopyrimidine deaminase/5-amino-6-(5-phosphoribosylamino)uracil reductase RibD [Pseudoduganella plicata]GGZ10986.1 riboflavin biosynthesis protein RibD [Pseudoduganella plicata]